MGVGNFLTQMNPEALANYPEEAQQLVETRPMWSTAAFGIAVIGGAVASFVMLLKRAVSVSLFVVAVIAAIATNIHTFTIEASPGIYIGSVLSIVFGGFFVWYATYARKLGWTR